MVGKDLEEFFSNGLSRPVTVANDADVAGLAEFTFGKRAFRDYSLVVFLTLGTGIGSAVIYQGRLIPGTEFGHLKFKSDIAERYASNAIRELESLTWKKWGKRLNSYLEFIVYLLSPDAIILGGGVSKKFEKFSIHLSPGVPVFQATLQNKAGIIGAALLTIK